MNVIELEKPTGVVVSLGGQTAINLAKPLEKMGVKVVGTGIEAIDRAEDRKLFEAIMREVGIPQPKAKAVTDIEEGVAAALESKADIVVVCASADDYAEVAPKIKEMLGGKAILVVAGAPACAAELEAQGITNFINVKSNVLETLKFYLKELGI